jgi:predicted ATPase/DNA-binding winged helix-turn-helix (wHTH) protein
LNQGLEKPAGGTISFGQFEVDIERRLLLRDSQPIPIGSRALDILIALLGSPGELVSTPELIARVWPKVVAGDANVRAQIAVLRQVLGDADEGRRFIQNVPGRGYRFVRRLDDGPARPPATMPASDDGSIRDGMRIHGRDEIVAAVMGRLAHRRLVTLIGPGGIGKTAVAHAIADGFGLTRADGVRWIDLSGVAREDSAAEAVAVALGLLNFASDHSQAVVSWLKDKRLLLVLDCCERAVASVSALAERILGETVGVHLLVTSREALRAAGEQVVRLPPLPSPLGPDDLDAEQAMAYPAVQLFVERAASILGGFTLRDADVPFVVQICARLDGIPLAIELAAGHLLAIELRQLAALLEARFRLLPVGRRTALARHRTMNAVLEWSYETLSPSERELLLCLAVFEGECGLTAVGVVVADSGMSTQELAEGMSRLVDKSLVVTRVTPAGLGYYLLDTTRVFALECLRQSGRTHEMSRRHARYVFRTLKLLEAERHEIGAVDWFDARRLQLPNLRAALNWAYEFETDESFKLALSAVAAGILLDLSLVDQCRRRATQALEAMDQHNTQDPALEMRLRRALALASYYTPGPVPETVDLLERGLAIADRLNDVEYRAITLWGLWSVSMFRNEPERALSFAREFRATRTQLSQDARELLVDRMTGIALHGLGDQAGARVYLARVLWVQGETERGLRMCEDSVETLKSRGHAIARCHGLFEVAIPLHYMSGNFEGANADLSLLQDLAAQHGLAIFQAGAAWTALAFSAIEKQTDLEVCRPAARALRASRYEAQLPWLSGIMAEEALRRGELADGFDWIAPCLGPDNGAPSGWWSAELQRLRGELVAAGAAPAAREVALAVLRQAIETSRRQGSVVLELRATLSHIRVDRGYRARAELKGELDGVLAKFRTGSDTVDVLEARRLSAELAV